MTDYDALEKRLSMWVDTCQSNDLLEGATFDIAAAADAIRDLRVERDLLARYTGSLNEVIAERDALMKLITDHNDACQDLCGRGDQEAVRCKYRPYFEANGRRCPECPTYNMIEFDATIAAQERKP